MLFEQKQNTGKVIIPGNANVWPHEERTAKTLAMAGYTVEFICKSNRERETSADAYIDGVIWEMKAPNGGSLRLVERNIRKAVTQSGNIEFDSRRIKRIPDQAIRRELEKWASEIKGVKRLIFIDRHSNIIDIK